MRLNKIIAYLIPLFLAAGILNSQSITVTAPDSNDSWCRGLSCTIKWLKTGNMDANVKVRLFDSTGTVRVLGISDSAANNGTYQWVIPRSITPGKYLIRVKTVDNKIFDDSDVFTILDCSPSITVLSPNGGERIPVPGFLDIKWKTVEPVSRVKITAFTEEGKFVAAESTEDDGFFRLKLTERAEDRKDYKIRVESELNSQVFDDSDGFFELYHSQAPFLQITLPKGGEKLPYQEVYAIKWKSGGFDKNVSIELRKGMNLMGIITPSNQGNTYYWKTGTLQSGLLSSSEYGDKFMIKIKANHLPLQSISKHFSILGQADFMVYSGNLLNKKVFLPGEKVLLTFTVKNSGPSPALLKWQAYSVVGRVDRSTQYYLKGRTVKTVSYSDPFEPNASKIAYKWPLELKDEKPGDYTMIVEVLPSEGTKIMDPRMGDNKIFGYYKIGYQLKKGKIIK